MKKSKFILLSIVFISVKSFALTAITDPKELSAARSAIMNVKLTTKLVDDQKPESFSLNNGVFERKQQEGIVRAELGADSPILVVKDENTKTKSVFFVLWTSGGGTGHWAEIKEVQLEPVGPKEIKGFPRIKEDRPNIKAIKLAGNEIVLDVLLHGKNDPACCASSSNTIRYPLQ